MDNSIRLFIADSNTERTQNIIDYTADYSDIAVVGHCTGGSCACSMINELKPNVIITNLLLNESDGLSLIENINKFLSYFPITICISPICSEFITKQVFDLGASYFMLLPIEIPVLIKRITDVFINKQVSINNKNHSVPQYSRIEETIKMLLLEIGIPANLNGYSFLSYAICLLVEQNKISGKITKELYPAVALKFGSTVSRVERAIRHAIDTAWCRGKITHINEIFGINLYTEYEKPTSCEFISLVADRVIMMKNSAI